MIYIEQQHNTSYIIVFSAIKRRKIEMAASYQVRSSSFPSRPNPASGQVDEQFARLRSCETTSTSSSSISQNLNVLQDLNECLEKLLQLSTTQQTVCQEQNKTAVNDLLDGSLRLLDICNIAKDALAMTKDSLNEIQSILRRKRGDVSSEVKKYLVSRKFFKKSFQKLLKSLKAADKTSNDNETLTMLREAQELSATVFSSLLCFISGSNTQSKKCSKWSLVSKFVNQKSVTCEGETEANEFARTDAMLQSFVDSKSKKTLKMEDVQSLEMCIQDIEEGLESLFKSLIKARVSVLNMLGN